MSTSRCTVEFPVRISEIAFDHVYFAHYVGWFEMGRTEICRAAGMPYSAIEAGGVGSVVTEVQCRYRRAARADDTVSLTTRLAERGRATFAFEYELVRANDGKLLATGFSRHLWTDTSGKIIRAPENLSQLMEVDTDVAPPPRTVLNELETAHPEVGLRVRFGETDAGGVVYNAQYLVWLQMAWEARLKSSAGMSLAELNGQGIALPVAELSCRFLSPSRYDDEIEIYMEGQEPSRSGLTLDFKVQNRTTDSVCAAARVRLAYTEKNRLVAISEEIGGALSG